MIDLRQLRYFVHIAEIGNLNKAAQVLNVAQSALSRQMSKLEVDFGCRLFVRHGRGVALTDAGRALQAEATKLLGHAREVEIIMKGLGENSGEVTIGLPAIYNKILCEPIMRAVSAEIPGLKVKFLESYSGTLSQLLRMRAVDIAILFGVQTDRDFDSRWIMSEKLCVIGEQSNLPRTKTIDLAGLNGRHLIMPHRPHTIWDLMEGLNVEPGRVSEAATLSAAQFLIENEQGLFVHQLLASQSLTGEHLVALPIEQPSMQLETYITTLKSSAINKNVAATMNAAVKVAEQTLR